MWWEEAARKGKAPPLEWPALSPLQPLRFRGQPPPAPEGDPRRAERIGSVRFGLDRFGLSPQGLNDMRLHRAVSFCCGSCLAMLCRKRFLFARHCRRSCLGTCRAADAVGWQCEGLSRGTQVGAAAEHSAFYSFTQETDGSGDVPGIAKRIRRRNRSLQPADVFQGSRGEISRTLSCMQLVGHTFSQDCQHCICGGRCRCTRA